MIAWLKKMIGCKMKPFAEPMTTSGKESVLPEYSSPSSDNSIETAARLFPSDPARRRAILVLTQHDIEKCAFEPDAAQALLAEEELHVLRLPICAQGNLPCALQNLVERGLARPGGMLVQSPYDPDTYEDASHAAQRFALAKHMHFSTLCMHLGAKEVTVEQVDLVTRTEQTSLDIKAERLGVGVEAKVKNQEFENFRAQMSLHDKFTGGSPNLEAAEKLLKQTKLYYTDPTLKALLEMRRGASNQLVNRRLVLSLSNDAKSSLKVTARLKIPNCVKLSADYEKIVREQNEYQLTVLVSF